MVDRTTPDPETPIFGELNKELGELPEIDIHDFEMHAFGLLKDSDSESSAEDASEKTGAAESDTTSQPTRINAGGRRRKEN